MLRTKAHAIGIAHTNHGQLGVHGCEACSSSTSIRGYTCHQNHSLAKILLSRIILSCHPYATRGEEVLFVDIGAVSGLSPRISVPSDLFHTRMTLISNMCVSRYRIYGDCLIKKIGVIWNHLPRLVR